MEVLDTLTDYWQEIGLAIAILAGAAILAWLLLLVWLGRGVFYLALRRQGIFRTLFRTGKELIRLRVDTEGESWPLLPVVMVAGLVHLWLYL